VLAPAALDDVAGPRVAHHVGCNARSRRQMVVSAMSVSYAADVFAACQALAARDA
jgi:hypothetical protein